jgi:hypothetical protein
MFHHLVRHAEAAAGYSASFFRKKQYAQFQARLAPVGFAITWKAGRNEGRGARGEAEPTVPSASI